MWTLLLDKIYFNLLNLRHPSGWSELATNTLTHTPIFICKYKMDYLSNR